MDPPITACKGRGLGLPPYKPPKPEKGKKKKGKKKGKKGKKGALEPPAKPIDDGDGFRCRTRLSMVHYHKPFRSGAPKGSPSAAGLGTCSSAIITAFAGSGPQAMLRLFVGTAGKQALWMDCQPMRGESSSQLHQVQGFDPPTGFTRPWEWLLRMRGTN